MKEINIYEYPTDSNIIPEYRIAVMQAALQGKTVEFVCVDSNKNWEVSPSPIWDWSRIKYRIKSNIIYVRNLGKLFNDGGKNFCFVIDELNKKALFLFDDGTEQKDTGWDVDSILDNVKAGRWETFDGRDWAEECRRTRKARIQKIFYLAELLNCRVTLISNITGKPI